MPTILPPTRNQLGEVIARLESLGGRVKTDFRMTTTRWGETGLEVSDELYAAWTGTPAAGPEPVVDPEPEPEPNKSNGRKSSGGK